MGIAVEVRILDYTQITFGIEAFVFGNEITETTCLNICIMGHLIRLITELLSGSDFASVSTSNSDILPLSQSQDYPLCNRSADSSD